MCWEINIDDYTVLLSNNCHYCHGKLNETSVGLDRKDNSKGYTLDNVVPCCAACNTTRSDNYTYEEMVYLSEFIRIIKDKREVE